METIKELLLFGGAFSFVAALVKSAEADAKRSALFAPFGGGWRLKKGSLCVAHGLT